ncbi:MAG TPA: hypothetical protein VIV60_23955, partial [Polyangiaceae bacterium]
MTKALNDESGLLVSLVGKKESLFPIRNSIVGLTMVALPYACSIPDERHGSDGEGGTIAFEGSHTGGTLAVSAAGEAAGKGAVSGLTSTSAGRGSWVFADAGRAEVVSAGAGRATQSGGAGDQLLKEGGTTSLSAGGTTSLSAATGGSLVTSSEGASAGMTSTSPLHSAGAIGSGGVAGST